MAKKQVLNNDASMGLVNSRDPSTLKVGELTEAVACEYRAGSPHLYKQAGRVDVGASLGGTIQSMVKAQYDTTDDVMIVDADGKIFEGTATTTPVFGAFIIENLDASAVSHYTGFKDRWLRCNGVDQNMIREFDSVPGGSNGNWRNVGMEAARDLALGNIVINTNGGQVLRPTTYTNQVDDQGNYSFDPGFGIPPLGTALHGYRNPTRAFDAYSGVGIGTVSGTIGETDLVGVNTSFLTQLTVGTTLTYSDGTQSTVLSISSNTQLLVSSGLTATLAGVTFVYSGSNAVDITTATNASGFTGDCYHLQATLQQQFHVRARACICTWKFTTNLAYPGRQLLVHHYAHPSPENWGPIFGVKGMSVKVEYSLNGGSTYLPLGSGPRYQPFPDRAGIIDGVPVGDGIDTSNLWVKATVVSHRAQKSGQWLEVGHGIYDIKLSTGASSAYSAEFPIFYAVSEVYTDSDGVDHISNIGKALQINPVELQSATSVTLTLPEFVNPLATKMIVWRSVDAATGGEQALFKVGDAVRGDGTWTDNFIIRPNDADASASAKQYQLLQVLYPTGELFITSFYTKPPLSFMTLPFQGCLCYFPVASEAARRVYYSLPATVSPAALEQVPEQYYLDFQTPNNDDVKSGAVTNGGRSMLVFFENYTMLVNYLPQGGDPGGFNNTVKEFVSNIRGCSGPRGCTEFTLPVGQTLVGAVDGVGLWVTNGVNQVDEWSEDLDWEVAMAGVDLSTIILVDNPIKRRLEMVFDAADGSKQEYHFFYGRMKAGIRNHVPLITGPHPSGVAQKIYTVIDSKWEGFSGSASDSGLIFHENEGTTDEANGYDGGGTIPFSFTSGDIYPEGLTRSNILEQINMKFSDGVEKTYDVNITMIRDKGTDVTVGKTFSAGSQQQIYVHKQLDRVRVQVQDLTATEASAFVGMAYEFRDSGISRDK